MDVKAVLAYVRRIVNEGVRAIVAIRVLLADVFQVMGHVAAAVVSRHAATVAAIYAASDRVRLGGPMVSEDSGIER